LGKEKNKKLVKKEAKMFIDLPTAIVGKIIQSLVKAIVGVFSGK